MVSLLGSDHAIDSKENMSGAGSNWKISPWFVENHLWIYIFYLKNKVLG